MSIKQVQNAVERGFGISFTRDSQQYNFTSLDNAIQTLCLIRNDTGRTIFSQFQSAGDYHGAFILEHHYVLTKRLRPEHALGTTCFILQSQQGETVTLTRSLYLQIADDAADRNANPSG